MVSSSFWTSVSYKQFMSLVMKSRRTRASSNTAVLWEENNFYHSLLIDFSQKLIIVAFKCSSTAVIIAAIAFKTSCLKYFAILLFTLCFAIAYSKNFKSSHLQMFLNSCSKTFHKFYRKTLVMESIFNKVAGFIKKRIRHRCSPVKFTKFLRTPFFTEDLRWLLLKLLLKEVCLSSLW